MILLLLYATATGTTPPLSILINDEADNKEENEKKHQKLVTNAGWTIIV